jgi:hypothetical protein
MNTNIQQIMRESLYGSPTLPQSAQSTFSPSPFRSGSQADPNYNFQIGTAEFGFSLTDEELNNAMKQIEPLLNSLGVQYWSVNQTDKVLNISVNNENIDKAKDLLNKYGFIFNNKTFGGEPRTPDMNSTPKLTAYGREAGQNSAFGGGGLLNGYPIDRLAGE